MKFFFHIIVTTCLFLSMTNLYAMESLIRHQVTVPGGQSCPATWKGTAGDGDVTTYSGDGQSNAAIAPGVRECSGCAYNSQSQNCVCATCTDFFN
ncbi:MAG TPA: hypothetical protein VNC84_03330 [Gammaproteobacteria bacterium]|nr:hypothetical protein [Gammaproteobacteria bacterium]